MSAPGSDAIGASRAGGKISVNEPTSPEYQMAAELKMVGSPPRDGSRATVLCDEFGGDGTNFRDFCPLNGSRVAEGGE